MKKNLQKATGMLLLMMVVGSAWGQTTLAPGDLILVTVNSDSPDNFDFVPLVDIASGTVISFTDKPWTGTEISTSSGEGIKIYTASSSINAGTVISFSGITEGDWLPGGGTFNIANNGDNILVFQGSSATPSFILGFGFGSSTPWISVGTPGTENSYIPSTLSEVANTIVTFGTIDNYQYKISSGLTGTKIELLTKAATASNFIGNNTTTYPALDVSFNVISADTPGLWKSTAASSDWSTESNWNTENIPTSGTNVILPTGASNYPTISAAATCNNIIIEDDASLIGVENLTIGGTATMQRSIPAYTTSADGWHLLSSPVGTFSIDGSPFDPAANDDFYGWSEDSYTWMNHKVGDPSQIAPGVGYLVSYETTATKDFTGNFNDTDITLSNLSLTAGQGNGWHLLGNPFQSALHWTNNISTWEPTAIGIAAKILNSGGGYTDITSDGINQYIPANQGFFVQATDATNSLTIPLDERTHNSTAFYKSPVQNSLTLKASDGEFYVETWIQMMEGATADFDEQYDVNFLGGMYQAPYLYSIISGESHLSTNRIAPVNEQTTVPLAFKAFLNREYTITASNAGSFGDEIEVILEDTQENIQIDLKDTLAYTFMATADELTERFVVHFFNVTGIFETTHPESVQIYSYGNRIYLRSELNAYGDVTIYNLLGQNVYHTPVELNGLQSFNLNLNTGWYVIQVVTKQGVKNIKVFIN